MRSEVGSGNYEKPNDSEIGVTNEYGPAKALNQLQP